MIRLRGMAISKAVNEKSEASEDRKGIRQALQTLDRLDVELPRSSRSRFRLARMADCALTVTATN
jgi:hypothetical protein